MFSRVGFVVFLLLLCSVATAKPKYYVNDSLEYFWDFENRKAFQTDIKSNTDAFLQGKIKWVHPEFSFQRPERSGVIHIHGDKAEGSMLVVSGRKMQRDLTDWTIDFEFAVGTHAIDEKEHGRGELVDGTIMQWGDVSIHFIRDPGGAKWKGVVIVNFRGKEKFIQGVSGFDYHYMAIRSEDTGISIWFDSYCTNLVERPRRSVEGKQLVFGGNGFAGRIDDIKIYSKRLRPWEITANFWGNRLNVNERDKLATTWANIKLGKE